MGLFRLPPKPKKSEKSERPFSYLADVLVVAACVLLLKEELVPHPASSHSLQRPRSSDVSLSILRPPSAHRESGQRQAEPGRAQRAQEDSPHCLLEAVAGYAALRVVFYLPS